MQPQAEGASLCAAGGGTVMSRPCCPIWGLEWARRHAIPPTLPSRLLPRSSSPQVQALHCNPRGTKPEPRASLEPAWSSLEPTWKSQERAGPQPEPNQTASAHPGPACRPPELPVNGPEHPYSVPPDHSTDFLHAHSHARSISAHANANANRTPSHGCWASKTVAQTYLALFLLSHANARFLSAASLKNHRKLLSDYRILSRPLRRPNVTTALCAR